MNILKLTFLLSAAHFSLVILVFLFFGLGLEGKRNLGHEFLWLLIQPGASVPGPWIFILVMNSFLWGFCGAVLLKVSLRLFSKP